MAKEIDLIVLDATSRDVSGNSIGSTAEHSLPPPGGIRHGFRLMRCARAPARPAGQLLDISAPPSLAR